MNRGLNSGARVNDMSRVDYAVIRVIVNKMEKNFSCGQHWQARPQINPFLFALYTCMKLHFTLVCK